MDYEKKYKEALEWARKVIQGKVGFVLDEVLEKFPELKESKDEKIRKAIIQFFELQDDNTTYSFIPKKDILAWLEKQSEQKLSGEVKPKFKVGDWVVYNNKHQSIYQVEKIKDWRYILRHTHGGTFRVCVLHDESLRLWTIQDAKDGDILYENKNNTVLIFRSQRCGWIKVWCDFWISKNKFTGFDPADYGRENEMDLKPATIEQRNLLFQKMYKAGYTFDFENKELKKIERNPSWGKKDEKIKQDIENLIHFALKDGSAVAPAADTTKEDALGWLKFLKERYSWKPSDEQMEVLVWCMPLFSDPKSKGILESLINDLKKLKEE